MTNRLADATSPYLLQHKDNPVDWREWSDDAFAAARERDVPILLSVGYAACHWCHVMAHESFEDDGTAAYMNEHFVCIKVDREERPDVDAVYMRATQAMTGQGGWPMTCVLTPTGEPFFAGTYFPPQPRHGMPAFSQVLATLADAWENKRDQVDKIGADVADHLGTASAVDPRAAGSAQLDAAALDDAVRTLAAQYDAEAGGFAGSPKFPPSMVLEFLLRYAHRTGSGDALAMVDHTCEAMARGGMYDQLGGGFARYSVDRYWRVPHFEKMLYDNALLLRLYVHWWRQTGSELAHRVVRETATFLCDQMRTPQGGFASALDADTDGAEGTYYVWRPGELVDALGEDDGAWAAGLFEVTETGTFEHGASTLQLLADPDDLERLGRVRSALRARREQRTAPPRDDKIVAAWNGLAITALAEAGVLLRDARFVQAAAGAAELIAAVHIADDGTVIRTSREGRPSANAGVLEDYGCLAEGFLAVLGATGDPRWLDHAGSLLDQVLDRFGDGAGGFFDTAKDAEVLVFRPKDVSDNASPSGTSAVAAALLSFAAITGDGRFHDAATAAIGSAAQVAADAARFAGWTLAAAEAALAGPVEVAVVGPDAESRGALHRAALASPSPGAVVIGAAPGVQIPLFEGRALVDGQPAAYVCRGFVCQHPVTDPAAVII